VVQISKGKEKEKIMWWPFRKRSLIKCSESIRNFLRFFSEMRSVEDQLKIARKKDKTLKLECVREGKCPDCKTKGQILEGPHGGMYINVRCDACGSRFNITPFGVERLK